MKSDKEEMKMEIQKWRPSGKVQESFWMWSENLVLPFYFTNTCQVSALLEKFMQSTH